MSFGDYFEALAKIDENSSLASAPILVLDRYGLNQKARELLNLKLKAKHGELAPHFISAPALAASLLGPATKRMLSKSQAIAFLKEDLKINFKEAIQLHDDTAVLRRLGLSFDEWKKILFEFEKTPQLELNSWTERIMAYLKLQALAATRDLWESPWSALSQFSMGEAPGFKHLFVPALVEAYPIEKEFIECLAKSIEIHKILPSSDVDKILPSPRFKKIESPESSAVFWAILSDPPANVEVTLKISQSAQPFFSKENDKHPVSPFARALMLWLDYHSGSTSLGKAHPLYQSKSAVALLEKYLIPIDENPTASFLKKKLGVRFPDHQTEFLSVPDESTHHELIEWLLYFAHEGLLSANSHPISGIDILPILPIQTVGLMPFERAYLWGESESLLKLSDIDNPLIEDPMMLPYRLQSLIESFRYQIPRPSREAELLRTFFTEMNGRFHLIEVEEETKLSPIPAPEYLLTAGTAKKYSPSMLEAYYECPLRFYLGRDLRIEREEEWDADSLSALGKGKWIHKALESFFQAESWLDAAASIKNYLESSIDEIFFKQITPVYRKILSALGEVYAESLGRHIETFEGPLRDLFSQRKIFTEQDILGVVAGNKIWGKLDRIDVLNPHELMVWDYKTGSVDGLPITQIKNGKFQWFLYREMIRSLGSEQRAQLGISESARVVGGGYLNPLEPEKSYLFVDSDLARIEDLERIFQNTGHHFVRLDGELEERIKEALFDVLDLVHYGLSRNDFSPRPRSDTLCYRCDQNVLCGRLEHREKRS